MILPDSYTPTSLQSQISELSDPRTEVTPVRVANLVTQYFVAFLLEKSGIEIYTSDEVEDLYHAATANLLESRLLGDDSTMTGVVGISCR